MSDFNPPADISDNCGTPWFPIQCPIPFPFSDGRNGICYNTKFDLPVCSTYMTENTDDTWYRNNVLATTDYASLDKIQTQSSIRASIQVAGLMLSVLTFCYVIVLTPPHKRYTTIFRAIVVGLLCSIVQQSIGTWLWTSSVRVAIYPLLTNDWAGTELSMSYRAALIIMHTASVMALGCVQVALWAQCRGILTRLKLKYPDWVYTAIMWSLVALSAVAFLYHMAFQGYLLFWYGFTPRGVQVWEIPKFMWYFILHIGSSVLVSLSIGLWTVVITRNTLGVIWERREALFSNGGVGELNMAGAPVVGASMPGPKKRRSRTHNIFEATMTLIGLVSCQSFVAPLVVIVFTFRYLNKYFFDSLLVAIMLAMLPVSSLLSNLAAQKVKTVDTEIVQRRGYPMHQFHPLPGAEGLKNNSSGPKSEQVAELNELSSGAHVLKV